MTPQQIEICQYLGTVTYLPGSSDKKAAMALTELAEKKSPVLTDKQIETMYQLLYKYRRQIPVTYMRHKHHPLCKPKTP